MKILVTGSSGYLGARLCHALLRRCHSVRALVRRTSDVSSLPPVNDAFELAYGDVTDYRSLTEACSGCEIVFHAAALVEPWLPDPSKFVTVKRFFPYLNFRFRQ
ncbi:NAD(P)-binding Rossmann-fold superfamily protein [Raphanus sativus]|nr:NAD(P)-binding Rossmann-fold superfamily protein [Raphanus sativus]